MSLPTVEEKAIDFKKFSDSGILVDASGYTLNGRKCYIIKGLDPDIKEVDVAALIEEVTGTFNKYHTVILYLTDETTEIQSISGSDIYLKVEGNFSLPHHLKILDQYQAYSHIRLVGSSGNNKLGGSSSDDKVYGGDGEDTLSGNAGNDTLYGHNHDDKLWGDAGDDMVHGGEGDDVVYGNAGNDKLYGDADNDVLYGNAGNDDINGGDGKDLLRGDAGDDNLFGAANNDLLKGGDGEDRLDGGTGNDTLWGGVGNDTLWSSSGDDKLYGGSGFNQYSFIHDLMSGHKTIYLSSDSEGGIIRFEDQPHVILDDSLFISKKYFIKWDQEKQEAQIYLFDVSTDNESVLSYSGSKGHITVKGFSKTTTFFIDNGDESVAIYKIEYRIKGQKGIRDLQTLLPRGTKEVLLPTNCTLVDLYGPNDRPVIGAVQRSFDDKRGKLNALFGIK